MLHLRKQSKDLKGIEIMLCCHGVLAFEMLTVLI